MYLQSHHMRKLIHTPTEQISVTESKAEKNATDIRSRLIQSQSKDDL